LSIYLDASVLVPLIVPDAHSARADAFMDSGPPDLVLSDFAAAEFASAVARLVRMSELRPDEARTAFTTFDSWSAMATRRLTSDSDDTRLAESLLRGLDVPLSTPDVLNLAIVQRLGCDLATFDAKMALVAKRLGLAVIDL
jgi:predicted nucleic acid-binding protein